MLSRLLLQIDDKPTNEKYKEESKASFAKLTPIATFMVLSLTIAVEVMMRTKLVKIPNFTNVTSGVNWAFVVIMVVLSILVRKFYHACIVVGPLLTAYCFYYFCIVDYSGHIDSLYNIIVVGLSITYLLLAFYMENWLANSLISIPFFGLLMWRQSTGFNFKNDDSGSLVAFRCFFLVVVYSAVAYKTDKQNKLAFLGRQTNEVSFNRWLKTFEGFPEGIALVRNDDVIYNNQALRKLFNLDQVKFASFSGFMDLKKNLQNCKIKNYVREGKKDSKRQQPSAQREMTVWEFIQSSKPGGIFEIQQQTKLDAKTNTTCKSRRYIMLRQISVRVGGRNEKLLIVRDESQKVYLEYLMETQEQMQEFTDTMVQQIDVCAHQTSETLKDMENHVQNEGKSMVDDCCFEMKKMRYKIRDYQNVYDIADNDFTEPDKIMINIGVCLKEVQNAMQNDLIRQGVEVSIAIHDSCPQQIPADRDLFIQVMINLLQQTVQAVGGRGFIKINTYKKNINSQNNLVIDFDASKFDLRDKQMAINIINLGQERDLRKILSADVQLNFKIAKILSNQLGWKVEFNSFTASRYSLFVPLVLIRNEAAVVRNDETNIEETKEEQEVIRPTTSVPMRSFQKKTTMKGDKYQYKDNYEQLDQVDEGSRPYSAQVPHITSNNMSLKTNNIKAIKEDTQMENEIDSPTEQNSTRTLGMDSQARAKFRGIIMAPQTELCLLMNFTEVDLFHEANFKCHECFTEADALKRIQKSLNETLQFKYFAIEIEESTRVNLKWLVQSVKDAYLQHDKCDKLPRLKIIVMSTTVSETLLEECKALEIIYSLKPSNLQELRQILNGDPARERSQQVTTTVQNTTEF